MSSPISLPQMLFSIFSTFFDKNSRKASVNCVDGGKFESKDGNNRVKYAYEQAKAIFDSKAPKMTSLCKKCRLYSCTCKWIQMFLGSRKYCEGW